VLFFDSSPAQSALYILELRLKKQKKSLELSLSPSVKRTKKGIKQKILILMVLFIVRWHTDLNCFEWDLANIFVFCATFLPNAKIQVVRNDHMWQGFSCSPTLVIVFSDTSKKSWLVYSQCFTETVLSHCQWQKTIQTWLIAQKEYAQLHFMNKGVLCFTLNMFQCRPSNKHQTCECHVDKFHNSRFVYTPCVSWLVYATLCACLFKIKKRMFVMFARQCCSVLAVPFMEQWPTGVWKL